MTPDFSIVCSSFVTFAISRNGTVLGVPTWYGVAFSRSRLVTGCVSMVPIWPNTLLLMHSSCSTGILADTNPIATFALLLNRLHLPLMKKECLGCTWACEKFSKFLIGLKSFTFITDHKPLIPLLSSKDIYRAPTRIQRGLFALKMYMYLVKSLLLLMRCLDLLWMRLQSEKFIASAYRKYYKKIILSRIQHRRSRN